MQKNCLPYTREWVNQQMQDCTVCPRNCHANRLSGQTGFCSAPAEIHAARAALHFWEEPCISGSTGSGTVFFSGCNLQCCFCQNHDIALSKCGREISSGRLVHIFFELQEKGAHNINLVTPTHYLPQIAKALYEAKEKGLHIPVVYNSSGYESVTSLQYLEGLVDIYLPDFKYISAHLSTLLSHAPDYTECADAALAEMLRQTGDPVFSEDSLLQKGVMVRHLVLPGQVKESKKVLRHLHETYGNHIYISIMSQYTPLDALSDRYPLPELARPLSREEYDRVMKFAGQIGIENGFYQTGEVASESFIPPFSGEGL